MPRSDFQILGFFYMDIQKIGKVQLQALIIQHILYITFRFIY